MGELNVQDVENIKKKKIEDPRVRKNAEEWIRCQTNPLYFIYNYVYIPETGGKVKLTPNNLHPKMKRVIRTVYNYHNAILMASRQLGKALDLETPIPLYGGGYRRMGDLNKGDIIFDEDGNPTKILETTEVMYNRPCYRITFDNDETIIADEEHEWKISNSSKNINDEIITTRRLYELENEIKKLSSAASCRIKFHNGIEYSKKQLPIHPYILGLWLGDGEKNGSRISCSFNDYNSYRQIFESYGIEITEMHGVNATNNSGNFTIPGVWSKLRELGLLGNKHIPENYQYTTVEDRLELLRGLMDSDGGHRIRKSNTNQFYQDDFSLVEQVQQLLSGLGIKSKITKKMYKGKYRYKLTFTSKDYKIFNLERKNNNEASFRNETKNLYIKDIESVESVPVKCIQVDNWKGMFLAGKNMVPTHNSTVAACLIAWASVFFPRNRAVILNMKKDAALNNIEIIRYVINNLPAWMVTDKPFKQKGEIKTYIDLFNESKIQVFYPSTVHKPETLARSLTSPILYVDEAAYIKSMHEIYGSAQQTLSRAREQAKRNNYPYMTLVTSTPNGTHGIGKWFFDRWEGAADSDYLFKSIDGWEEKWNDEVDVDSYINDPSKNTFTRIKYHWSEDPNKTYDWYKDQCRDLNDQRLINQELDLIFVGTQDCIFDDDTLARFESRTPVTKINTPHFSNLEVYDSNPSPGDYYLIGCDTAESLTGAYCAIEVFSFKDFNQIAELKDRFGSYTAFANAIDFTFQWLRNIVGENIIICVENNTIGKAPIENLRFHNEFDYDLYLYRENIENTSKKPEEYGIKTTGLTKPMMAGCLIEYVNENIQGIRSRDLIDQFSSIEKTNSGSIRANSYSDLFMATCFCAYVRNKRAVDIMPIIERTPEAYTQDTYQTAMGLIQTSNLKQKISIDQKKMEGIFNSEDEMEEGVVSGGGDMDSGGGGLLPFFSS